ncbi:GNAT family N-acetyltransferase [Pseudoclavibacter sp. RFBJ3]|uniref:GNAT family N-acetyltransferase n=1 Tax=unclassified Pseudoclavibacter TaxID=2615177 RepID=UPI000CE8353C|nr:MULTISPECIES: GNAT family N-acetyltransferase [unclassified Pseudoclavibacter]PPF85381.1 GNAT family N-acetyltransferase [Pseudoclavibacter sp. RFBJ5]PPF93225.1 GNAT family N-acetyltransferase [Pseudoclavibacter sp. RFBJ3]PPF98871.1 GNAT family N-acetyltransferase [Pseudoclavibacter sp. RFBH5]PPG24997.1 GNAT family N-acetyltransferase [Pseudoclavibacter sp. RFBI4]
MIEDHVRVEAASELDVAAVANLIAQARAWLASRGIDQWQDEVPMSLLESDAAHGRLFVVRDGDRTVATVTLSDSDTAIWGTTARTALYVHRLVVTQTHRGVGLGESVLDWARSQATAGSIPLLRLDCATENRVLRSYYEQRGFRHVRDATVISPDGARELACSLYEAELPRL